MEYINQICKAMKKAEMLNALHACREGHPLGRGNPYKFRNALAMVCQSDYFDLADVPPQAMKWLESMAKKEVM